MKNFALGRYLPLNTILHRLDPRLKLSLLVAFFVLVFWPNMTLEGYLALLLISTILVKMARLSIKRQIKTLLSMWFMLLFLLIMNLFIRKSGVEFNLFGFTFYSSAFTATAEVVTRLFLMLSFSSILTATTKPLDLTYALEFYLYPLKYIRFPVHECAMMLSIALRFIPTLLEEMQKIMKAQASRGVDLENGKLHEKIVGIVSLLIPLFTSALDRSDDLANAMEARGYNPLGKRTRYRQLHFRFIDLASFIIVGGLFTSILFLRTYTYQNQYIMDYLMSLLQGLKNG